MRTWMGGLTVLLLVGACGGGGPAELAGRSEREVAGGEATLEAMRTPQPLDAHFAQAAEEFGVPEPLLKAVAYTETRWEMLESAPEFDGQAVVHGLMGLKGPRLGEAARLAGVSEDAARTEPLANIRAAAALLASDARALGIDTGDLGAWAPVVARYSGIASEEGQAAYVHHDVYAILRRGAVAQTLEGETAVSLLPREVEAQFARPERRVSAMAAGPDYTASVWRPSPNYNARPTGDIGDPAMIIIHTCEGSYTSCWSWLTNSSAGVSAHYVVSEDGAEVSQLVLEANRAWHVGATYDCSLNSSVDCWRNGNSVNHFSVGIEHGGYASQASFPTAQIDTSAQLACDISRDQAIPRDRYHIVAHAQLQPYNRTDPGPNWPWSTYLSKVNSFCGTGTIIVDSNNANNDASVAEMEVSANWVSSSSTPGYYGSGYFYATTSPISDGASFWFYLPVAATKTVDAWWTAGTNRSAGAPFIAYNAAGTQLGTVYANQQVNGGAWNTLGTWSFSAGWNRIVLSRWATEGYVVIADAVRIR